MQDKREDSYKQESILSAVNHIILHFITDDEIYSYFTLICVSG